MGPSGFAFSTPTVKITKIDTVTYMQVFKMSDKYVLEDTLLEAGYLELPTIRKLKNQEDWGYSKFRSSNRIERFWNFESSAWKRCRSSAALDADLLWVDASSHTR